MMTAMVSIAMVALLQGNRKATYYDLKRKSTLSYAVPDFAQVEKFEIGHSQVVAQLKAPLPKRVDGRLTFELYFLENKTGRSVAMISPLANYDYPSRPPLRPGQTAVVDTLSGEILGRAAVFVEGKTLRIVPNKLFLRRNSAVLGLTRYAPSSLDDSKVNYGSDCISQIFFQGKSVRGRGFVYPVHPDRV